MSRMRVAIIGANGFIARHLAANLSRKDLSLFLFGRSESSDVKGGAYSAIDLNNVPATREALKEMDLVYYMISETMPASSWADPSIEVHRNLIPFLNFMEAVSGTSITKVAFISSGGTVYGTTSGKVREDADKKPFSPYGIMKLTIERFLEYYHLRSGIQSDIYRVSNVYGVGQDVKKGIGIINTFLESIVKTRSVRIYGDGLATRNYIHVSDVAEALSLSASDLHSSHTLNVSSNDTLTINELVHVIRQATGESFEVTYEPGRQSDNSFVDLDNSALIRKLGGHKFIKLSDGIRDTFEAIRKKAKTTHG